MGDHTLPSPAEVLLQPVSFDMFGGNIVLTYQHGLETGQLGFDAFDQLGLTHLRFPGGTATEHAFAESQFQSSSWDAATRAGDDDTVENLMTLDEFFKVAASTSAAVQLVLPTRVAFEKSAGQALADGTYGARTELSPEYFGQLAAYLEECLRLAQRYGVEVDRLEIGNEYWGSGEMTASEYGYLATMVGSYLSQNYPDLPFAIQITSSAGRFSPLVPTMVALEPTNDDDFIVHFEFNASSAMETGWTLVQMPASGSAQDQIRRIAEAVGPELEEWGNFAGLITHVYFDPSEGQLDAQRDFALKTAPRIFEELTGIATNLHVTEWGVRTDRDAQKTDDELPTVGLGQAHNLVESFYELASSLVDTAAIWPLYFSNANILDRVLIDVAEGDLTFGGAVFSLLSSSLPGLAPMFEYEVLGDVDIHCFGGEERLVLYVADRTVDTMTNNISLDLSATIGAETTIATVKVIGTNGKSAGQIYADPVIELLEIPIVDGILELSLEHMELAEVTITTAAPKTLASTAPEACFGFVPSVEFLALEGMSEFPRAADPEGNCESFEAEMHFIRALMEDVSSRLEAALTMSAPTESVDDQIHATVSQAPLGQHDIFDFI